MITLRDALEQEKLGEFIAEHEGETGDREAFEATLRAMTGTSKSVPGTSSQNGSDD
jgi:hypothetical protein